MDKMLKLIKKTILALLTTAMILNINPVSTNVTDNAISTYCNYPEQDSTDSNH